MTRVERHGLDVAAPLATLIEEELLTGVTPDAFWSGYAALLQDLAPENRRLLQVREDLQAKIDAWHAETGPSFDAATYRAFLSEIGYLDPEPGPFAITTGPVDPEIAAVAGPQLVVPVTNARFALNAANARWGSLYDAYYGTDAVAGQPAGKGYDAARGADVIALAKAHLDIALPLVDATWAEVCALEVEGGALRLKTADDNVRLSDPAQFAGYLREADGPLRLLFRSNGLLIEVLVDPATEVGQNDPAGISDVRLESALTAIMDCEDSVATVDAEDKCVAYRNWLGLMRGDLEETFEKGGETVTRRMNPDVSYLTPEGDEIVVKGRALMLVRNVGHLMTTDAVLLDGEETPEGMLDAVVTVACAMHDIARNQGPRNSSTGSVYVVKPKMHGPQEVAFADTLYARVEDLLGLPRNTVKLGLMDEERRTSANLLACMEKVKDRLVFINTGFLDRTGDEIHTSMQAGPVIPKGEMKDSAWLKAYEDGNVDAGLAAGLPGHGQIGKGMWAKPDEMAEMLQAKIGHPRSGATTAWVPSPTAATLHATHYHMVDVFAGHQDLKAREVASKSALLDPPLLKGRNLDPAEVRRALEECSQSILGYVVRWVDQGVGCSKVPDITDTALMEDRATLRISSQLLANWLMHGLVTRDEVEDALRRMAVKVDAQNEGDTSYRPMAPGYDGPAFRAARALVLEGAQQPSGYTEPLLHKYRREVKETA
ncbi:malate synthase G [Roseicyclus sp. F158]|uniref:Malate synthase G n=1 Tax=Tropicimonas omnivorans TaxID=3075590 RepID=A0ABU3DHX6_9RHOB|nr:malate synthase G [Roseicyclus sp. F158]MDT0683144.1 malate synthase G [Roseicyclus sp. F158]